MEGSEKEDSHAIVVECETEEAFEVDKIVGKSVINGEVRYKIRWRGYSAEEDTWEPMQNLQSCMDLVNMYEKRWQHKEDEKRKTQISRMFYIMRGWNYELRQGDLAFNKMMYSTKNQGNSSTAQRDTFWKDLEAGHINVFATDMYSRVKSKKRSENVSVNPMKDSDTVKSAREESLGEKMRKGKTRKSSLKNEGGKRRKSSSIRKADNEMDHRQIAVDKVEVQDMADSLEAMSMLPHVCNSSGCWNCTTSSGVMINGSQDNGICSKECHGSTGSTVSSNVDSGKKDNSSSKYEREKINVNSKDASADEKLTMQSRVQRKRKSSTFCQLSQDRMTSEAPVTDSQQKSQMHTTGATIRNRSRLKAVKEPPVSTVAGNQEADAVILSKESAHAGPTKESNLGIYKNDPISNQARPVKKRASSLPSLADVLRKNDDSEVIIISSIDIVKSPTCEKYIDKSLAFPKSTQSNINAKPCESLARLNTEPKSSNIQKDGDSKELIGLSKSVSVKRKSSSVTAFDGTKKETASVVMKDKDEPAVPVSKTASVTSSSAVEKFHDTKTGFTPVHHIKKNDGIPTKTSPYPSASLIMPSKIRGTAIENESQGQDGCKKTCFDSEMTEMRTPCSFKTEEEHRQLIGPVKQEADVGFDVQLDDLDWAQLEEELKLKAVSDEDFQKAVWNGNLQLVQQALSCGQKYDLERPDLSGKTLLMMAVDKGYESLAECLLENGAIVDAQLKNGTTALMLAAQKGFTSMVDLLVKLGSKMNRQTVDGDTALMMATRRGHVQVVKQLLLHGANFSAENKDGVTALIYSQKLKFSETENAIIKHIRRITAEYEKHLSITLNNTAKIVRTIFPLQCFVLCEGTEFIVKFSHVREPTTPGVGFLLFIAHAMFSTDEVHCRFYGPCAVTSVYLNEVQQSSMTAEGNYVFSFNPVIDGNNQLVIKTMKASQSKTKLLVCAYKAQLLES